MEGEQTGLKEVCLLIPVTYSLLTHTRAQDRLCSGCVCARVGVCVFTVLLRVCLAGERSGRWVRDGDGDGGMEGERG